MKLVEIPEELIDYIICLLDSPAPSLAPDVQLPTRALVEAVDTQPPLKALSLTCRKLRRLTFGTLFEHMRFNASMLADTLLPDDSYSGVAQELDTIPAEYDPSTLLDETLGGFEAFVKRGDLPGPKSLLVYSVFETEREDRWHGATLFKRFWQRLLGGTHGAVTLTIIAPPMALARLTQLSTETRDIWAFDMPFQRLRLESPGWKTLRKHGEGPLDLHSAWSHLAYDEGSSLNLYGHYHYQDKLPPSILHESSRSMRFAGARLVSLTYTAVFPHYDSFRRFLKLLKMCDQLQELHLKLAPQGSSPLLSDDQRIGHGNTSFRDCWNELERCYWAADLSVTCHMAEISVTPQRFRTLPLRRVCFHDCAIASMEADFATRWQDENAVLSGLGGWKKTDVGCYDLDADWVPARTDA